MQRSPAVKLRHRCRANELSYALNALKQVLRILRLYETICTAEWFSKFSQKLYEQQSIVPIISVQVSELKYRSPVAYGLIDFKINHCIYRVEDDPRPSHKITFNSYFFAPGSIPVRVLTPQRWQKVNRQSKERIGWGILKEMKKTPKIQVGLKGDGKEAFGMIITLRDFH